MGKRQDGQGSVILIDTLAGLPGNGVPDEVFVRKFHALRTSGRTGGVDHGGGIIFPARMLRRVACPDFHSLSLKSHV